MPLSVADLLTRAWVLFLLGAAFLAALGAYLKAGGGVVTRFRPRPPDVLIQWGDAPGASLSQPPIDERTPNGPRWTKVHLGYRIENVEMRANVYDVTTGGEAAGREFQIGAPCAVLRPGDDKLFDGDVPAELLAVNREAEPQKAYTYWIRLRDADGRRWRGQQRVGENHPEWRRAR